nr:hypothetical protein RP007_04691 [Rhizobium sp. P007]
MPVGSGVTYTSKGRYFPQRKVGGTTLTDQPGCGLGDGICQCTMVKTTFLLASDGLGTAVDVFFGRFRC